MDSQSYKPKNRRTHHWTVKQKKNIGTYEDLPTFTRPKLPFTSQKRETFCFVHGTLYLSQRINTSSIGEVST